MRGPGTAEQPEPAPHAFSHPLTPKPSLVDLPITQPAVPQQGHISLDPWPKPVRPRSQGRGRFVRARW